MLMPKKNRVAIYEALFKDGVLVAEKKFSMEKHNETEVPNLHVVKACQVNILMLFNFWHTFDGDVIAHRHNIITQ